MHMEPIILCIKIRLYISLTSCPCRQLLVIAVIIDKADITSPLQYFQANLNEFKFWTTEIVSQMEM